MSDEKSIVLTGGGTAGHVLPHFAIAPHLRKKGWEIQYIGSKGMERQLVSEAGIRYWTISSGKLRRYFSAENFVDIFRVLLGCLQSIIILLMIRPKVVFSKGGFVSVPVAFAAWLLRIPVITHESDLTPGLATRIIAKFCRRVLYSFADSRKFFPEPLGLHAGSPIRENLLSGDSKAGKKLCGFASEKRPVILVMGGSLGAVKLNQSLAAILPELCENFCVIHLTGKGKGIEFSHQRYRSFEYLGSELPDIYAAADMVISRAGANSLFEILALKKPMLLIPLEAGSRGDQVHNAENFVSKGWARMLREKDLTNETLLEGIRDLHKESNRITRTQTDARLPDSIRVIVGCIEQFAI